MAGHHVRASQSTGVFLGVGATLVLPDEGQQCPVWSSEEIGPSRAKLPSTPLRRTPPSTAPDAPQPPVRPQGAKTATAPPPVPVGEGMSRPILVERGKPVSYSREALDARVEGTMIVRCTITVEARVEKCVVLQTLPFLEQSVLENLYTSRFRPRRFKANPWPSATPSTSNWWRRLSLTRQRPARSYRAPAGSSFQESVGCHLLSLSGRTGPP